MATNIFAVNKTDDKNSERLDGERFVTKVVDVDIDAIDEEYDKAERELEEKLEKDYKNKTKLPRWLSITFWVMTLVWLAAVVLYVGVERFDFFPENIPATPIAFVVSLVYVVVYAYRKSLQKKLIAKAEKEAEQAQEANPSQNVAEIDYYEEARRELGVPENAQIVDVFTYVYKMVHGSEKRTSGKNYINLEMHVFSEDSNLCIVSANKKLCIPLESIKSFTRVESKISFMLWNKKQRYDDPAYAGYNISRTGLFSLVMNDYYKLQIVDNGAEYEILIPTYDKDVFAAILGY